MRILTSVLFFLWISPIFSQRALMCPWKLVYSLFFNRIHWAVTRIHLYTSISGANILDHKFFPCAQITFITSQMFSLVMFSFPFRWCLGVRFKYSKFGGSKVKASACNAGDLDSIPGSGRSPGKGNGNPLQYSCLENSMDRMAWAAKSIVSKWVGHD